MLNNKGCLLTLICGGALLNAMQPSGDVGKNSESVKKIRSDDRMHVIAQKFHEAIGNIQLQQVELLIVDPVINELKHEHRDALYKLAWNKKNELQDRLGVNKSDEEACSLAKIVNLLAFFTYFKVINFPLTPLLTDKKSIEMGLASLLCMEQLKISVYGSHAQFYEQTFLMQKLDHVSSLPANVRVEMINYRVGQEAGSANIMLPSCKSWSNNFLIYGMNGKLLCGDDQTDFVVFDRNFLDKKLVWVRPYRPDKNSGEWEDVQVFDDEITCNKYLNRFNSAKTVSKRLWPIVP